MSMVSASYQDAVLDQLMRSGLTDQVRWGRELLRANRKDGRLEGAKGGFLFETLRSRPRTTVERQITEALRALVDFYADLAVAGAAGLLPEQWPHDVRNEVTHDLDLLGGGISIMLDQYPLVMLLARRLTGNAGSEAIAGVHLDDPASAFSRMVLLSHRLHSDPAIHMLLRVLEGDESDGVTVELLDAALTENNDRSLPWDRLSDERSPVERSLFALFTLLDWCVEYDEALQGWQDAPAFQAVAWGRHAAIWRAIHRYWRKSPGKRISKTSDVRIFHNSNWLRAALALLQRIATETSGGEEAGKIEQAIERLFGDVYETKLRRLLAGNTLDAEPERLPRRGYVLREGELYGVAGEKPVAFNLADLVVEEGRLLYHGEEVELDRNHPVIRVEADHIFVGGVVLPKQGVA